MNPINGWNELQESGIFEQLELGGHICVIKGVRDGVSKSGKPMLTIQFDTAPEDRQPGFYQELYEIDKKNNPNAKWRNSGLINQMHHTDTDGYFKAFINRILESNPGYQWSWDEKTLVGKKFGGVFGREEYLNDKGESKFAVKCVRVKALDGIENESAPADKLLKKDKTPQSNTGFTRDEVYRSIDINDADLPF